MNKELLFFVSTLGWFNGLLLSFYFLFFQRNRKLSGLMFGFLLLALSIRVLKSVLWWFNPNLPLLVIEVGLVAFLYVGPLLYYFVRSTTRGIHVMPRVWKYILGTYGLVSLILILFFSTHKYIPFWRSYLIPFIYFHSLFFALGTSFELKATFKNLFDNKIRLRPNEKWVITVYLAGLIITLNYIFSYFNMKVLYISGPITFSILVYLHLLLFLYRKRTNDLFESEPEKYANKKMDIHQVQTKIEQLEALMIQEQVFINPDLKLNELAAMIQLSGHQLSELLNDNLGKSFNTYINGFRIKEACEMVVKNNNLTLEAIGYEVGFNSKSAFFAAFKKFTGLTPKQFKEQLR